VPPKGASVIFSRRPVRRSLRYTYYIIIIINYYNTTTDLGLICLVSFSGGPISCRRRVQGARRSIWRNLEKTPPRWSSFPEKLFFRLSENIFASPVSISSEL